jgi:hypothetical protein
MVGRPVAVQTAGGRYEGTVTGVDRGRFLDPPGRPGSQRRIVSGDVQMIEVGTMNKERRSLRGMAHASLFGSALTAAGPIS